MLLDASIFLYNTQLAIEFPNSLPSFIIKLSNTSTSNILTYNYQSITEYNSQGGVVRTYPIPTVYNIIQNVSYLVNDTVQVQNLTFYGNFPNNASLVFSYQLVSTDTVSQFSAVLNNNSYILSNDRSLAFFDISLKNWEFGDKANSIVAGVQVIANVDPLSIGYSQSDIGYTLSIPFLAAYVISAVLPTTAILDNGSVVITTNFQITSYSQPVSANAFLNLPNFSNMVEYKAYFQIVPSKASISLLSIIIIVCIVFILICFCSILGCFICRYHKKSQKPKMEHQEPDQLEKNEIKTYNTLKTVVSISDVFKMKI